MGTHPDYYYYYYSFLSGPRRLHGCYMQNRTSPNATSFSVIVPAGGAGGAGVPRSAHVRWKTMRVATTSPRHCGDSRRLCRQQSVAISTYASRAAHLETVNKKCKRAKLTDPSPTVKVLPLPARVGTSCQENTNDCLMPFLRGHK